jgi:hypothetical protein
VLSTVWQLFELDTVFLIVGMSKISIVEKDKPHAEKKVSGDLTNILSSVLLGDFLYVATVHKGILKFEITNDNIDFNTYVTIVGGIHSLFKVSPCKKILVCRTG